ncbi:MAG: YceI family protein [Acidimicrobiia bacterium]|nr:YceI family protein [Acidimicrobiia bacterium]
MQATATLPQTGTWTIDPTHTTIGAVARHLVASKVRGSFTAFSGTIEVADQLEDSKVSVSIDPSSIDTGVADRDGHLRSADFLNVEEYPEMTFTSTAVRQAGKGYEIDGDLTMAGVTNPITLELDYLGVLADPWGNPKAMFAATGKLEREQWGLTWNAALESGGLLVSKTFDLEIEAQAALA